MEARSRLSLSSKLILFECSGGGRAAQRGPTSLWLSPHTRFSSSQSSTPSDQSSTVLHTSLHQLQLPPSLPPLSLLLISLPSQMPSRKPARAPCPLPPPPKPLLALGLEGSANKLGVGLILHSPPAPSSSPDEPSATGDPGTVSILSNIRHTYVTPPGEGFLPSDTARHHKRWIGEVVEKALKEGGKTMEDVDVVCFTKGAYLFCLPSETLRLTAFFCPSQDLEWAHHCTPLPSSLAP